MCILYVRVSVWTCVYVCVCINCLCVYVCVCIYFVYVFTSCHTQIKYTHRHILYVCVCVSVCTSSHATSAHLPDDESVTVDIGHDVRLEVIFIQALVQDLGGHVAPRPNTCAQRDVHFIGVAGNSKESFSCSLTGSFVLKDISSFSQGSNISSVLVSHQLPPSPV